MGLLQLEVLVWILYSVLIRKLHVNNNTTHWGRQISLFVVFTNFEA